METTVRIKNVCIKIDNCHDIMTLKISYITWYFEWSDWMERCTFHPLINIWSKLEVVTAILVDLWISKEKVMLTRKIGRLFIFCFILSKIIAGRQVEYKVTYMNCNLTETRIAKSPATLGMCAALCAMETSCHGFGRRRGDCILLDTCPRTCCSAMDEPDAYTVHCSDGKIICMYLLVKCSNRTLFHSL